MYIKNVIDIIVYNKFNDTGIFEKVPFKSFINEKLQLQLDLLIRLEAGIFIVMSNLG